MILKDELNSAIRTIPNFPKRGIMFKDITPILRDPNLVRKIAREIAIQFKDSDVEVVAGVESRGFLFGMLVAQELNCSFAIIRKKGKLPHKTVELEYALEYGSAIIEMHEDEIKAGQKVMIHDDLLATGGTAGAAAELVKMVGGEVVGFSFVIGLDALNGKSIIERQSTKIVTLINY